MNAEQDSIAVSKVGRIRTRLAKRLRQLAGASALSPVALAAIELVAQPFSGEEWLSIWKTSLLLGPGVAVGLLVLAAVVYALGAARGRAGHLTVDAGRLGARTEDGRVIARDARPTSGVVIPSRAGARAEVGIDGGDTIHATFASVDGADGWLSTLGLEPSQRAVSLPTVPAAEPMFRALAAATGAVLTSLMMLGFYIGQWGEPAKWFIGPWLFLTTLLAVGAVALTRPAVVRVGLDGIWIRHQVRSTLLRFREMKSVRVGGRGLEITLSDGTVKRVWTRTQSAAAAIAHRIARVRGELGASTDPTVSDLLARGGRTIAAWRDDLRRWSQRGAAFRDAGPSQDALAGVLTDPDATTEARVGAALALRESGGDLSHVRVAAAAAASPRLRAALETVAGEDATDEAIEEATAALEAEG